MQDAQPNLFTRDDTMLGVCEGLGEDLGFNPLWLRLALTLTLFFNPVAAIGGYLALGVLVVGSRLLFPAPGLAAAELGAPAAEPKPLVADNESDAERLPMAA